MIQININLVFTIINLIVLYLLLKKVLLGRIMTVIEKRNAMIQEQFSSARESEERARSLEAKYEDALKSAKEESFKIMDQAKAEANVQALKIVQDANDKASSLLAKARKDIAAEQENAMREMEGKVAELAMDAASKIMGDKNSTEKDLSLYDQFIKEAGDLNDGDGK